MRANGNGKTLGGALAIAVKTLGGYEATGRVCAVSGKAVRKWVEAGRLPRTEATGETNYAELMASADPRICMDELLATVMHGRAARREGKTQPTPPAR